MCGLAGTVTTGLVNLPRLKLISIFLRSRGKHSTGIFLDGYITKDIDKGYNKDYGDPLGFFNHYYFNRNKRTNLRVAFVHNRFATYGEKTIDNAHPFEYEINGVTHIFAHNGTIENIYDLCREYNINFDDYKVDSKALGFLFATHGTEILKKYKGAAAFIYFRSDMPDSLYVWKGMSRQELDTPEEERPLFYTVKDKAVYFASETTALICACDTNEENVLSFDSNTLIKITGTEFEKIEYVDRSHIQKKERLWSGGGTYRQPTNPFQKEEKKDKQVSYSDSSPEPHTGVIGSHIYMHAGRYKRNGHLLEGKYIIDEDGQVLTNEAFLYAPDAVEAYFYKGIPLLNDPEIYQKFVNDTANTIISSPTTINKYRHPKLPFFHYTFNKGLYYFPSNETDFVSTGRKIVKIDKYVHSSKLYVLDLSQNTYYPKQPVIKKDMLPVVSKLTCTASEEEISRINAHIKPLINAYGDDEYRLFYYN
ncbi:MAG: hypothetical protein E6Q36_06835 [Chryseobacterium sp.]|nr:MAG: hypothetical protein E6Q36_06835 [Chryseobacterium sp.]